jgi:hypothetical protein
MGIVGGGQVMWTCTLRNQYMAHVDQDPSRSGSGLRWTLVVCQMLHDRGNACTDMLDLSVCTIDSLTVVLQYLINGVT